MLKIKITNAKILTLAYLTKKYPAYASLIAPAFSGGKALFDLRVTITDSEGVFLENVTSSNVKVIPSVSPGGSLLHSVKAAAVLGNPPNSYHVQAFAKPAPNVAVHVKKGRESGFSPFFNIAQ